MKPSSFNSILEKYNKIYSKEFPYTTKFDTILSKFLLEQENLQPAEAQTPAPVSPETDINPPDSSKSSLPDKNLITNVKLLKIAVASLYTDIDDLAERYPKVDIIQMRNDLRELTTSTLNNFKILQLIYKIIKLSNPPEEIKDEEKFTEEEIKDYGSMTMLDLAQQALLIPKKELDSSITDLISQVTDKYKKIEALLNNNAADMSEISKMVEDATQKIQTIINQTDLTDATL